MLILLQLVDASYSEKVIKNSSLYVLAVSIEYIFNNAPNQIFKSKKKKNNILFDFVVHNQLHKNNKLTDAIIFIKIVRQLGHFYFI